jgi:hypothetical protein
MTKFQGTATSSEAVNSSFDGVKRSPRELEIQSIATRLLVSMRIVSPTEFTEKLSKKGKVSGKSFHHGLKLVEPEVTTVMRSAILLENPISCVNTLKI